MQKCKHKETRETGGNTRKWKEKTVKSFQRFSMVTL